MKIVNENEIQFIRGVFSAIPKYIYLEKMLGYELPYSEESDTLGEIVEIQHTLADFEITVFDSSYVEIIRKRSDIIQSIERKFSKE